MTFDEVMDMEIKGIVSVFERTVESCTYAAVLQFYWQWFNDTWQERIGQCGDYTIPEHLTEKVNQKFIELRAGDTQ